MTFNPTKTDPSLTLSNNNLTVAKASGYGSHAKSIGMAPAQGTLRKFRVKLDGVQDIGIGLATAAEPLYSGTLGAASATSACIWSTGWRQDNTGAWHQFTPLKAGQEVAVSYDPATKTALWHADGALIFSGKLVLSGDAYPAISLRYQVDKATGNFTEWADASTPAPTPTPPPPPPPPPGEYWILVTDDPSKVVL